MAVKFDNLGYYVVPGGVGGLVLPDSDWALSIWLRLSEGLDAGSEELEFFFASENTGGNANNLNLWFGHTDSSWPRQLRMRLQGNTGDELVDAIVTNIGDASGVTDDVLLVLQRRGSNIEAYWVEKGATVSAPVYTEASNNTEIAAGFWNIGRAPTWPDYWRYRQVLSEVSVVNQSFTAADVEDLAAGASILTKVSSPQLYLRFLDVNDPEPDLGTLGLTVDQVNGSGLTQALHPFEDGVLVSYTGEGGAEVSGQATVESFDPSVVLVAYVGTGEIELYGSASAEEGNALLLVDYLGQGGFNLSGSSSVWVTPIVVGSGGLSLYGAARVLNVPALPYSPNELFTTNNSLAANFLYNRLLYQRNPLGARDEFTYTTVPEYESLVGLPIEVLYVESSQTILYRLGNVAWEEFAQVEGVQKLDVTMHPEDLLEVCWEVDGEIFTKTLTGPVEKVANGTQPYIVRDERREEFLNSSDTMLVYTQFNNVFLRKKSEDYLVEYATSLMDLPPPFTIIGFGMTDTFRLQIRVQVLRSEEI